MKILVVVSVLILNSQRALGQSPFQALQDGEEWVRVPPALRRLFDSNPKLRMSGRYNAEQGLFLKSDNSKITNQLGELQLLAANRSSSPQIEIGGNGEAIDNSPNTAPPTGLKPHVRKDYYARPGRNGTMHKPRSERNGTIHHPRSGHNGTMNKPRPGRNGTMSEERKLARIQHIQDRIAQRFKAANGRGHRRGEKMVNGKMFIGSAGLCKDGQRADCVCNKACLAGEETANCTCKDGSVPKRRLFCLNNNTPSCKGACSDGTDPEYVMSEGVRQTFKGIYFRDSFVCPPGVDMDLEKCECPEVVEDQDIEVVGEE